MSTKITALIGTIALVITIAVSVTVHDVLADREKADNRASAVFYDRAVTHAEDAGGFTPSEKP